MSDLELDKKLAQWLGWDIIKRGYNIVDRFPLFSSSIYACFEYLIPKLFRDSGIVELRCKLDSRRDGDGYRWSLYTYRGTLYSTDFLTDPALALCKTIEKVIDHERKRS